MEETCAKGAGQRLCEAVRTGDAEAVGRALERAEGAAQERDRGQWSGALTDALLGVRRGPRGPVRYCEVLRRLAEGPRPVRSAVSENIRALLMPGLNGGYLAGELEALSACGADLGTALVKGMNALRLLCDYESPPEDADEEQWVLDAVRSLARAGVPVDALDEDGISALHNVSSIGWTRMVETLIACGATVDRLDGSGATACHGAAMEFETGECVRCLLEAGADANAVNAEGSTPLMQAALGSNVAAFRHLLAHGADIHARDALGTSMLYFAVCYEEPHEAIVARCLEAGLDPLEKTADGDTPFECARREHPGSGMAERLRAGMREVSLEPARPAHTSAGQAPQEPSL